jgi:hypothetical protein
VKSKIKGHLMNKIVYMALVFIGVILWLLIAPGFGFFESSFTGIIREIIKKIKNIFRKKYYDE